MKIKLRDPAATSALAEVLRARIDAIVSRVGDDELEVSLLGSRAPDADEAELRRRIEAWGGSAEIVRE